MNFLIISSIIIFRFKEVLENKLFRPNISCGKKVNTSKILFYVIYLLNYKFC